MKKKTNTGFTLIELLVVIAIIGILAAILIPAVGAVRASANNTKCVSNMRSIAQATLLYAKDVGRFPSNDAGPGENNWAYDRDIMPYMGFDKGLVEKMRGHYATRAASSRSSSSAAFLSGAGSVFACPSDDVERGDPQGYVRSYSLVPWMFNWGNAGGTSTRGYDSLPNNRGIPEVKVLYPAKAAMLVEWHAVAHYVGGLGYATCDGPGLTDDEDIHGEYCNVAFADGHVSSLNYVDVGAGEFIAKYWGGAGIIE